MPDYHGPEIAPHRRFFELLRPERADIGWIVLFSVVTGFLYLATPLAVDAVVNNISFGSQQPVFVQSLVLLSGVLLAFLVVLSIITALQYVMVELIQQRIFTRLAADFAYRLPRLEFDALERTRRPELVNKFLDVVTVQKSSAYLMLDGVNVVLATSIGLLLLAFYHPFLLAFDLFLIVALAVILGPLGRHGVRTSLQESYAKHAVAGWLEQVVLFPILFKTAAPAMVRERTNHLVDTYLSARRAHFRVLIRQILGLLGLEAMASALLLAIGGLLVLQGQLTLGQLVASELVVSALVASMVRFGKNLENWYDSLAAIDKLGSVVDLPVERQNGGQPSGPPGACSVEFAGISFAYPDSRPVFDNLNLQVSPGEHVAITGPIGSGAGTLLDLVYGLRSPAQGLIRVGGLELPSWSLAELRQRVMLVREPEFIDGTLAENITLGRPGIPAEQVREALEAVGLRHTLNRFPDGLAHRLRAGGRPLSDDQRILVSLARAIVAGPGLLLIDKVLDGLDPREMEDVLSVLFDRTRPWTLLIASRDDRVLCRFPRVFRLPPGPDRAAA